MSTAPGSSTLQQQFQQQPIPHPSEQQQQQSGPVSSSLPAEIPAPSPSRRGSEISPLPQGHHGALPGRNRRRGPPTDAILNTLTGASKIGPQRSTKNVQKLKILPFPDQQQDEESGRDVYSQVTRIKDFTARRDAERLGKAERAHLPRVTAYCTANAYKMEPLMRYLKARAQTKGAAPKQFDECIYTPYSYQYAEMRAQEATEAAPTAAAESQHGDLIDLHGRTQQGASSSSPTHASAVAAAGESSANDGPNTHDSDEDDRRSVLSIVKSQQPNASEVFLFNYGVVVIWGMNVADERRFLKDIAKFETEKLSDDDVQVENFNYYITDSYQPRIYNDFITLNNGRNYMIKVAISHAIAQSVKISLFEDLVENTIEETKNIPQEIATTGKVKMGRRTIMMHIGELFILKININLQGSVLDSPELMWSEPELEPTYAAARSYLEINQRVSLLNQRLDVIGDLLQMLKEQLSHAHGEYLEWIVIILIAAEIFVGLVNIAVDVLADGA